MYRALWDRRHEGATRISQCTRRVAPSALTYPSGPWVAPEHLSAEIYRLSSEAGGGESCIVENLCMVL